MVLLAWRWVWKVEREVDGKERVAEGRAMAKTWWEKGLGGREELVGKRLYHHNTLMKVTATALQPHEMAP